MNHIMWFRALRVFKKNPHPRSLPGDQFSIFSARRILLQFIILSSHIVSHETVCWTEKSEDQRNMEILLGMLFLHCNMFSIAIRQWPHFNGISSTFAHFFYQFWSVFLLENPIKPNVKSFAPKICCFVSLRPHATFTSTAGFISIF